MKLKSVFPSARLRPSGLRARFLMAHLSVALLGVIITASYARYALDRAFAHHLQEDMMLQARLLADQVAQGGEPMARDERWTKLARRWSKINGGHWTIYDSTCRMIGDSGSPSGERSLASQPTPSSALKGKVGVCLQRGMGVSGKRLLLAVPIWREELIVGVVRASVPLRTIDLRTRDLRNVLIVAGALLLVVSLIASLFWAKTLSDPLRDMEVMARRIAAGDWEARVAMRNQGGEIGSLATSLNRMANELHRMFDEVHRFARAQQELVANVAHELRTPVATIRAAAETLTVAAKEDPGEVGQFAEMVQAESERLSRLVENLLRLERMQAGVPLQMEDTSLAGIIEDAVAATAPLRVGRDLDLRTDALPLQWRCDREAMVRALINLLENAICHTPDGGSISVTAGQQGDEIVLSVADTGEGISPEHLPRIFERFYRADESRSAQSGGAGLGLAIVREVVEAHGGRVEAKSAAGKGTTIFCFVPVLQERTGKTSSRRS